MVSKIVCGMWTTVDRKFDRKFYCFSVKWAIANGVEYRKPAVLIVGVDDDEDPIFAHIEEIFVVCTQLYFKVSMDSIVHYSAHYHAYVTIPTFPVAYKLIELDNLYSPFPLHPRHVHGLTSSGQHALVLKQALCSL